MINLEVNLSIKEASVEVPNLACDLKMVNPDPPPIVQSCNPAACLHCHNVRAGL